VEEKRDPTHFEYTWPAKAGESFLLTCFPREKPVVAAVGVAAGCSSSRNPMAAYNSLLALLGSISSVKMMLIFGVAYLLLLPMGDIKDGAKRA